MDNSEIGATQCSENGTGVGRSVPKRDTGDNPEEVVAHFSGNPIGGLL